jgi:hypothetical protein
LANWPSTRSAPGTIRCELPTALFEALTDAGLFSMVVLRVQEDGCPEIGYFLIPAQDAEIVDTWDVRGLRGTGTHH